MKRYLEKKKGYIFGLLCMLLVMVIPAVGQTAETYFTINTETKSETKIELSWKKKAVSKYEIYRALVAKNGVIGKYKKLATIPGNKTTYTDKVSAKKYYSYKVIGYKKKNTKFIKAYRGVQLAYSGMSNAVWQEYQHCDAETTPESIDLNIRLGDGLRPTGYEIYRSPDGKRYKKIAVIKSKEKALDYTDTTVEAGEAYYYKVRAYRTVGGKKLYGRCTEPMQITAVNRVGKFRTEVLTEPADLMSELVISIASETGNGICTFDSAEIPDDVSYCYQETGTGKIAAVPLRLFQYSMDNQKWKDYQGDKFVIPAGQTVYLRFQAEEDMQFPYLGEKAEYTKIVYSNVEYNGLISIMSLDLLGKTGEARRNGEYYH